ncbi:MAG: outer membrane beta-barrel protein [Vicinamibacterales bacterium]
MPGSSGNLNYQFFSTGSLSSRRPRRSMHPLSLFPVRILSGLVLLCAVAVPSAVRAQAVGAELPPPRIRLGPLGLDPFVTVSDIGIDTNVLATAANPQRDFTARISPGVASSMRIGRARITARTAVGFSYFRETTASRTRDIRQQGQFALLSNRVSPRVSASYDRVRERPNLEINDRVRRTDKAFGVGADVRVGPRVELRIDGRLSQRGYADEQFDGVNLATELNQRTRRGSVAMRMALTPLTTFVLTTDINSDRFQFQPIRNNDSIGLLPGFELKPSALISGVVSVGYRHVRVFDKTLPDFQGVTGTFSVAYTFRLRTRFGLTGNRGIDYSFEPDTPYYVIQGAALTVTEALGRGWDVQARFGADTLVYRSRVTPGVLTSRRIDRAAVYGFGAGRRLGAASRLGVDVTHASRQSPVSESNFDGWRMGGSFTYGS